MPTIPLRFRNDRKMAQFRDETPVRQSLATIFSNLAPCPNVGIKLKKFTLAAFAAAALLTTTIQSKAGVPPNTLTPGQMSQIIIDSVGGKPVNAIIPASCAACGSLVVKSSAGIFLGATITTGATAGYLMLFAAGADPADGPVTPRGCIAVAANGTTTFNPSASMPGWVMPLGVTLVFSTTGCSTKTESATAFLFGVSQ
jgi:hypothetical protein